MRQGRATHGLSRFRISCRWSHMTRNRLLSFLGALVAVAVLMPAAAERAHADGNPCGIPSYNTLWIDYADSSVPFRLDIFARPGVIGAVSNSTASQALHDRGGLSVFWDMYLNNRVGTPSAPANPATIQA